MAIARSIGAEAIRRVAATSSRQGSRQDQDRKQHHKGVELEGIKRIKVTMEQGGSQRGGSQRGRSLRGKLSQREHCEEDQRR
jgi:hypothetical protein